MHPETTGAIILTKSSSTGLTSFRRIYRRKLRRLCYYIIGSVAKLKLYAHLYKTIKANIVLTVKSFVSINYFSFFSINII